MTGEDLRALSAAATPGPWRRDEDYIRGPDGEYVAKVNRTTNAELILWLRNHADALADLIDAASDHHHTECLLHDTRWGGVDTCDNLGVTPADSRRCPNCRLRDALAALEAAPARLAEVGSLRADNATLRDLLAKALPWVDPNESDDGHLLTVAITDALGDHRG